MLIRGIPEKSTMKYYYRTLDLNKGATSKEIKVAYRKLALKLHPDRNKGNELFNYSFNEVNKAYVVLSDPEKRLIYDSELEAFERRNFRNTYANHKNRQDTEWKKQDSSAFGNSDFYDGIKKFNPFKWIKDKFTRRKNLNVQDKLELFCPAIVIILSIVIYLIKDLGGLLGFLLFCLALFFFIYSIKNFRKLEFIGDGLLGLIVSPIMAFLLLTMALESITKINSVGLVKNENINLDERIKNPLDPTTEIQYLPQEDYDTKLRSGVKNLIRKGYNDDDIRLYIKAYKSRYAVQEGSGPDTPAIEPPSEKSSGKGLQKRKIPLLMDIQSKMDPSALRALGQLKNGASPFDLCFGKGVYSKDLAWLKFKNGNDSDAVVCLVNVRNNKTIRNEYIQAGSTFKMSKIPSGTYYIKTYSGNLWNPDKKNFCNKSGAFTYHESFSKSDNPSDYIVIKNSKHSYTTGKITLHTVIGGNMAAEEIDARGFLDKKSNVL